MKNNKKNIFVILSIIFSISLTLIIVETYVRIFIDDGKNLNIEMLKYAKTLKKISLNTKIGIEHKKNINMKLMNVHIRLNSQGFRNEHDLINDKKKILMLGDSMTFGWGANKTFSNNLEEKLGKDFQVLNAGIGNTNSYMQISNFFENLEDYKYDVIVLNFFINDLEKVEVKKGYFLVKNLYSYTYIKSIINELLINYSLKDDWSIFYSKTFKDANFVKKTFLEIIRLNNYCKERNIHFVIHNIPELRDLNNYKFANETKLVKNFAIENNIAFIDSIEILKTNDEKTLWVSPEDPHANNKAHLLIADFLYQKLFTIFNSL
jgi:hypothetical protein